MNAITLYRTGNWLYRHHVPLLPRLIYYLTFLLFNSSIPPSCEIGAGSVFAYGGIGVVIHANCRIGRGVMIGQNVTLGGNFGSDVPIIGDNVYLAAGVRVIGEVHIGSNVIIGANAVVTHDIPDNCIAAGVPARIQRSIPLGALDAVGGTLAREEAAE